MTSEIPLNGGGLAQRWLEVAWSLGLLHVGHSRRRMASRNRFSDVWARIGHFARPGLSRGPFGKHCETRCAALTAFLEEEETCRRQRGGSVANLVAATPSAGASPLKKADYAGTAWMASF